MIKNIFVSRINGYVMNYN